MKDCILSWNLTIKVVAVMIGVFVSVQICAQDKPNFIFVLTDDQSYGMMGCTGNDIVETPHIDQLASEGVLFTNAHITSAICTPSRTSILLSQYERKHGINFNSGTSMAPAAWHDSYPVVMRREGYYTGWIGKNHVPIGEGGYTSGLMEESFDYWYAGHGHLRFYPKEHHEIFAAATADTQAEIIAEGINDFLSNDQKLAGAKKFIDQRPKDKPFLLSISFNLPHGAGTSTMELRDTDDELYRTKYRDVELPLPNNYIAKEDIENPKLPPTLLRTEDRQGGYNYVDSPESMRERYTRQLQAMTGIDRVIGQIREKLKEEELENNTIIIFTSDHGLFSGEHGLGGKALCYEKVTHVPMIIFDPYKHKRGRGTKSDALVQSIDVAPTLLTMAGIGIPSSYQGKDLSKLLKEEVLEVRDYVFTENLWSTQFGNPRCESVQGHDWKYIRYYKNENFSATKKIAIAKQLGIKLNAMLYKVHDPDIAIYRDYIESPLNGEKPVYEELYFLKEDPQETVNLVDEERYRKTLLNMREVWREQIIRARGKGPINVLRYTSDSEAEKGVMIEPK